MAAAKIYIVKVQIEERDKDGKKTILPVGKKLDLTAAQAKAYGACVELKVEELEDDEAAEETAQPQE